MDIRFFGREGLPNSGTAARRTRTSITGSIQEKAITFESELGSQTGMKSTHSANRRSSTFIYLYQERRTWYFKNSDNEKRLYVKGGPEAFRCVLSR